MATLIGVLVLAAPFVAIAALVALVDRSRERRRHEILRQIAFTDALHARFGALVAPIVRRNRRGWRVAVAVPFERPAVTDTVLATAAEVFPDAHYEIVLSPQAPVAPAASVARPAAHGRV